jgi:hypothetical protein
MNTRRDCILSILGIGAGAALPSVLMASGAPTKKAGQESNFVGVTQVTATITNGARAAGIIQVDVGIYTTDSALKQQIANMAPLLRSRWRSALQDFVNRYYTFGSVPDANILAGALQRAIDPLTAPKRGRVLLQAIIIH